MIQRGSDRSKAIMDQLKPHVDVIKRMGVTIKDKLFYEEKYDNKVVVYTVKSKLMELYIFFGIIGYLAIVNFLAKVRSLLDLIDSLFIEDRWTN
jgi:hypothetical protein